MKRAKPICTLVIASVLFCLAVPARATLFDRGGGLIYDDVKNVTWLQDASAMNPNRPKFGGAWGQAADFAFHDSLRGQWIDDWRLPMQGELASLWNQGVRGGNDQLSSPFKNLVAGPYWGWDWEQPIPNSGPYSGNWDFQFGGWSPINSDYNLYAMPVRLGDVGAPPVPEPAAGILLLAGLGVLAGVKRRRASRRSDM